MGWPAKVGSQRGPLPVQLRYQGHCRLLPDHLAARFPGTLGEIEAVVAEVEGARSVEAAANALRPDDVTLATAVRRIRAGACAWSMRCCGSW
jgi:hypothetical protein